MRALQPPAAPRPAAGGSRPCARLRALQSASAPGGLQPSGASSVNVFQPTRLDLARDGHALETVQLVKVVFKVQLQAAEGMRLIGGHESMGSWSLSRSVCLRWTPGDMWVSDPLELPVDGVFVYKYVKVTDGGDARPLAWQQGNNQVLVLTAADAPLLEVGDNWRGDPSAASTSAPDGSRRQQHEDRLLGRVREADAALRCAQATVQALTEELAHARLQAKALREEARLGANVRLALKDQLRAEKKRSSLLEQQVEQWKRRWLGTSSPLPPAPPGAALQAQQPAKAEAEAEDVAV